MSMSTNVDGKLPPPSFNLDQLTSIFALNNLSQADMIALSGEQITTAPVRSSSFFPPSPLRQLLYQRQRSTQARFRSMSFKSSKGPAQRTRANAPSAAINCKRFIIEWSLEASVAPIENALSP